MSQLEIVFLGIIITKKWFRIFLTSYHWVKSSQEAKPQEVWKYLFHIRWNQYLCVSAWAVRDEILIYGSQRGSLSWFTYLNKVYDWFEERLEIQAIADDITSKYVPPHVNIFYCLGGITLTCFLVQVATGFAMTFYYRPTVTEAFSSVQYIMTEANFGWLIRSIRPWHI